MWPLCRRSAIRTLKNWKQLPKSFLKCPYSVLLLDTVLFPLFSPCLHAFIQQDSVHVPSIHSLSPGVHREDIPALALEKSLSVTTCSWPYSERRDPRWLLTYIQIITFDPVILADGNRRGRFWRWPSVSWPAAKGGPFWDRGVQGPVETNGLHQILSLRKREGNTQREVQVTEGLKPRDPWRGGSGLKPWTRRVRLRSWAGHWGRLSRVWEVSRPRNRQWLPTRCGQLWPGVGEILVSADGGQSASSWEACPTFMQALCCSSLCAFITHLHSLKIWLCQTLDIWKHLATI